MLVENPSLFVLVKEKVAATFSKIGPLADPLNFVMLYSPSVKEPKEYDSFKEGALVTTLIAPPVEFCPNKVP